MQSLKEMENTSKTIIELLQKEKFSNQKQRARFIDLITSLFGVDDKDSRKFMKMLGNACTDIGKEMLSSEEEFDYNEAPEIEAKNAVGTGYSEEEIRDKIKEYENQLKESAPKKKRMIRTVAFGPEVEEYVFGEEK
jgi:hypothetical protein